MLIEFSVKNYRSFWDTQTLPKKIGSEQNGLSAIFMNRC